MPIDSNSPNDMPPLRDRIPTMRIFRLSAEATSEQLVQTSDDRRAAHAAKVAELREQVPHWTQEQAEQKAHEALNLEAIIAANGLNLEDVDVDAGAIPLGDDEFIVRGWGNLGQDDFPDSEQTLS